MGCGHARCMRVAMMCSLHEKAIQPYPFFHRLTPVPHPAPLAPLLPWLTPPPSPSCPSGETTRSLLCSTRYAACPAVARCASAIGAGLSVGPMTAALAVGSAGVGAGMAWGGSSGGGAPPRDDMGCSPPFVSAARPDPPYPRYSPGPGLHQVFPLVCDGSARPAPNFPDPSPAFFLSGCAAASVVQLLGSPRPCLALPLNYYSWPTQPSFPSIAVDILGHGPRARRHR